MTPEAAAALGRLLSGKRSHAQLEEVVRTYAQGPMREMIKALVRAELAGLNISRERKG